jgi:hypothetical protein
MSTLKATNLQHASAASPNIVLDSSGNATMAGSMAMATPFAMRNKIINGAMEIDQRNSGASVTQTTSSLYTVDRWLISGSVTSKFTAQRNAGSVTPPAGFINYLGITSSSSYSVLTGDFFYVMQGIEGFNVADLGWGSANAKTITISFWVRSSLTGNFGGTLRNLIAGATRSYPFTYTVNSANTWEQKTLTIAGDTSGTWATDNTNSLTVCFGLGTGSTYTGTSGAWSGSNLIQPNSTTSVVGTNGATWYLTGVQLEVGSIATPFERRLYSQELAMCQRFFEYASFNVYGYQSTAGEIVGGGVNFRVVKRAQPTLGSIVADTGATPASSNVASQGVNTPGLYGCAIFCVGAGSANAGVNQRGYMFSASSEL